MLHHDLVGVDLYFGFFVAIGLPVILLKVALNSILSINRGVSLFLRRFLRRYK